MHMHWNNDRLHTHYVYTYTAAEVPPYGKWTVLYTEKFVCLFGCKISMFGNFKHNYFCLFPSLKIVYSMHTFMFLYAQLFRKPL